MSVGATEGQEPVLDSQGSEVVALLPQGDAAFGALMDALAPEDDASGTTGAAGADGADGGAAAGAAAPAGGAAEGGEGQAGADSGRSAAGAAAESSGGAAGSGSGTGQAVGDAAAAGADGAGSVDGAAAAGAGGDTGGGDRPAGWTQPAAELVPVLGELSTKFEENVSRAYHETALAEVKEEHANYFTALEKHPRLLVGTQVPAIGREGMETIRDTADAKEWQDAVKSILVEEVKGRAQKELDDNGDFLSTVHASIELFQNNVDLIPHTADFDVELANRFAEFAAPYELRVEGKLQGYSIPVQPLIDRIRAQLTTERASKASAPAETGTVGKPAAGAPGAPAVQAAAASPSPTPPAPPEPPQAGIQSKAGSSDNKEDFSTLFGTLGLPNLQI